MIRDEYDSLIAVMTEIKSGIKDTLDDLKKSTSQISKESSKTKDAVARIETKMETLVTKADLLEEIQDHNEKKHTPPPFHKSDYIKYGGVGAGTSTLFYLIYQIAVMYFGL